MRSFFFDAAIDQPDDARGVIAGEVLIMGGDNERPIQRQELSQQIAQFAAAGRIERSCRPVHQENRRINCECSRDGNSLCLATRQLSRQSIDAMLDTERREELTSSLRRGFRRHRIGVHWSQTDVVQYRKVLEQVVELKHHPDFSAKPAQGARRRSSATLQRDIVYDNTSRLERFERANRPKDRGLSGTRRSHERDELAPPNIERDALEDPSRPSKQAHVDEPQYLFVHAVGAFQRRSSRRANAASGSDITR
jgi:hypothetical protein